jgi:lipopolysaccharide transport system ATP-binding protein
VAKPSVIVEGVSKKFGLSIKSALKYGLLDSCRRLIGKDSDRSLRPGEFWALNDISFSLEPGDTLGIMGINGSGKTTLLRILNGTYSPDKGKVILRGRIGALIAAGAGFSPMLSGRENVYISGTLLGMTPREIHGKFDEIVAFAELGDFIDMPVRNYSSGMSVRLGFAIAVIGTPEILLVDEVLAVGDMNFQKKCYERIQALKDQGTTILLVSHSPGAIWAVCNKGLVIHKSRCKGIVPVEDACKEYEYINMLARKLNPADSGRGENTLQASYEGSVGGTGDVIITKVEVLDESNRAISEIEYGESFCFRLNLENKKPLTDVIIRMQINTEMIKSIAIIDNYESDGSFFSFPVGKHVVDIRVRRPNLRPGVYEFGPSVLQKTAGVHLYYDYCAASLIVKQPANRFFYADFRASVHLDTTYSVSIHDLITETTSVDVQNQQNSFGQK